MLINSSYSSPFSIDNGHLETILPYFFRRPTPTLFKRERIDLPDGDFVDIDQSTQKSTKAIILSHGLEGCSQSSYIKTMSHHFSQLGFDIFAWNSRGCSGEFNRLKVSYHSGRSEDLRAVVDHVLSLNSHKEVYLIGFSMGGNISLKYLGEEGSHCDPRIKKAVALSTPIHLADCAESLSKGFSKIYTRFFVQQMIKGLKQKQIHIGEPLAKLNQVKRSAPFEVFDNMVTAPLNGFKDANDYYQRSSSYYFLEKIDRPTLIINALNDPFLVGRCYPTQTLKNHPKVFLEMPQCGGHVGFTSENLKGSWMENRCEEFFSDSKLRLS